MRILVAILLLVSTSSSAAEFDWDVKKSVHENILAMEYDLQMYTLAFLVKETGRSCMPVLRAYQGGTESGEHFWMLGCNNGTDWSVMLGDDGYQVISCTLWEELSRRSCLSSFHP